MEKMIRSWAVGLCEKAEFLVLPDLFGRTFLSSFVIAVMAIINFVR